MNLKCTINGKEYNIEQGATFSEEFNEVLDSGTILIKCNYRIEDLKPYKDIFIYSDDNTFEGYPVEKGRFKFYKHLLVDRFNYRTTRIDDNLFNYTIEMFSETKGLETVQLPNISITQPLDINKKKSIYDYAKDFIDLYSPKYKVSKDDQTWVYKNKYTLSEDLKEKLGSIYSPDFTLNAPTLRELLSQLFIVVDMIPYVHDDVIYAMDISKTTGNFELETGELVDYSGELGSENYADNLKRNYNNALSQENTCHRVEYLGFRNKNNGFMTLSNMQLETNFPIYKINKVYACYYKEAISAFEDTAEKWSEDKSYHTDDLVKYNNIVFTCVNDVESGYNDNFNYLPPDIDTKRWEKYRQVLSFSKTADYGVDNVIRYKDKFYTVRESYIIEDKTIPQITSSTTHWQLLTPKSLLDNEYIGQLFTANKGDNVIYNDKLYEFTFDYKYINVDKESNAEGKYYGYWDNIKYYVFDSNKDIEYKKNEVWKNGDKFYKYISNEKSIYASPSNTKYFTHLSSFYEEYDMYKKYNYNDYIYQNNILYRCLKDVYPNVKIDDTDCWQVKYTYDQNSYYKEWEENKDYFTNDYVVKNGALYKALKDSKNKAPILDTSSSYWQFVSYMLSEFNNQDITVNKNSYYTINNNAYKCKKNASYFSINNTEKWYKLNVKKYVEGGIYSSGDLVEDGLLLKRYNQLESKWEPVLFYPWVYISDTDKTYTKGEVYKDFTTGYYYMCESTHTHYSYTNTSYYGLDKSEIDKVLLYRATNDYIYKDMVFTTQNGVKTYYQALEFIYITLLNSTSCFEPVGRTSNVPQFNYGSSYSVGDFVMYESKLYRCITTHTAAAVGGFKSEYWEDTYSVSVRNLSIFDSNKKYWVFINGEYAIYNNNLYIMDKQNSLYITTPNENEYLFEEIPYIAKDGVTGNVDVGDIIYQIQDELDIENGYQTGNLYKIKKLIVLCENINQLLSSFAIQVLPTNFDDEQIVQYTPGDYIYKEWNQMCYWKCLKDTMFFNPEINTDLFYEENNIVDYENNVEYAYSSRVIYKNILYTKNDYSYSIRPNEQGAENYWDISQKLFLCKQDITDLVKLNTERNFLSQNYEKMNAKEINSVEELSQYRMGTIGYDIGSNIISGWGENYTQMKIKWLEQYETVTYAELILTIMDYLYPFGVEKSLGKKYNTKSCVILDHNSTLITDVIVAPTEISNAFDKFIPFNEAIQKLKLVTFIVDYEAFYNGALIHSKDNAETDITMPDNVNSSLAILEYDGIAEKEKINRFGNEIQKYSYRYNNVDQIQKLGSELDDGTIMYHTSYSIYDTHILTDYVGSKDYVLKNYYTSVYARHRTWNLMPYGETVRRAENKKEFLLLSDKNYYKESENNEIIKFKEGIDKEKYLLNGIIEKDDDLNINYGLIKVGIDYYATDINCFTSGNSLCVNMAMQDSVSAGVYIENIYTPINLDYKDDSVGSRQQWHMITDETGYKENIGFYMCSMKDKDTFSSKEKDNVNKLYNDLFILPKVVNIDTNKLIGNDFNLNKDNKELIDMTYQWEFVTDTPNIVFSSWLMKINSHFNNQKKVYYKDELKENSEREKRYINKFKKVSFESDPDNERQKCNITTDFNIGYINEKYYSYNEVCLRFENLYDSKQYLELECLQCISIDDKSFRLILKEDWYIESSIGTSYDVLFTWDDEKQVYKGSFHLPNYQIENLSKIIIKPFGLYSKEQRNYIERQNLFIIYDENNKVDKTYQYKQTNKLDSIYTHRINNKFEIIDNKISLDVSNIDNWKSVQVWYLDKNSDNLLPYIYPIWESGKEYNVDDIVIYKGISYQCINSENAGNIIPESPNNDCWKKTNKLNTYPKWEYGQVYGQGQRVVYKNYIYKYETPYTARPSFINPEFTCDEWMEEYEYKANTCVKHNGATYICLSENKGIEPGTDGFYWETITNDWVLETDKKIYLGLDYSKSSYHFVFGVNADENKKVEFYLSVLSQRNLNVYDEKHNVVGTIHNFKNDSSKKDNYYDIITNKEEN